MEKEQNKTSGKGWIDVGPSGSITISCHGNLIVKTDAGATVRFSSNGTITQNEKENRVHSDGNLSVKIPAGVNVILERVAGNAGVKGVTGTVTATGDVSGNLTVRSTGSSVTLQSISGNLSVKDVGGKLAVKSVSGNAQARNVAGVELQVIHGDLSARNVSGSVSAETVHGNATVRQVSGDVTLTDIMGDCSVRDLAGAVNITCRDDIRIRGPLAVGKHSFTAASTIDLYYPDGAPLTVTATAPKIRHSLAFGTLTEKDGVLSAQSGDDGPMVTLTAADRIRIRPMGESGSDWDVYADIDLDFSEFGDIGERISAEINARMGDFTANIGPEFSAKAEQALRKAQAAIERTVQKMETEMSRAEHRAAKPPRPPRAKPTPQPKPDTTEAQLKILKMLEEGTISVEEANKLLAAIG